MRGLNLKEMNFIQVHQALKWRIYLKHRRSIMHTTFLQVSQMWRTRPLIFARLRTSSSRIFLRGVPFSTNDGPTATQQQTVGDGFVISKEILMKMRKETGYSYVKCRKALLKFGENNYDEAVNWIKETAIKEGWDKAAKLSDRVATQGLCGLTSALNGAVIVELNCETDFVARSMDFKSLVQELTTSLADHARTLKIAGEHNKLDTINIASNEFRLPNGSTAEEAIVAAVGKLGENIKMTRAAIICTHPSLLVCAQTHPKEESNGIQMGRFASFIAIERKTQNTGFPTAQLGQQLCQHIIGMVPDRLGEAPTEHPEQNEKETTKAATTDESEDDLNASTVSETELTRIDPNESQLLRQAFMLNPQQTIHEYLDFHGASIADFLRIELGREEIAKGV